MKQTDSAFEQWYNGMVGFHINSERILQDINWDVDYGYVDPEKVRKWMVVCWNQAIEAAQDNLNYNWKIARDNIENLKEKP
jgi:hypothetical protein